MTSTIAPEGRRLLRVEARNAQTPIERKPKWLRTKAVVSETYQEVRSMVKEKQLHTVCAEANCPNVYECWNDREASFLIGGEICTPAATSATSPRGVPPPTTRTSRGAWPPPWPRCACATPR